MTARFGEYKKQKRTRRLRRIGFFLVAVIVLLGLLSYVSFRRQFRIQAVILSGGVLVTQPDVEEETLKFISGSYFWIFPRDNFLIYPRHALSKYLAEKFKRIDTISISLKDARTLAVVISERKPTSLWCGDGVRAEIFDGHTSESDANHQATSTEEKTTNKETEKCYFLDDLGTVFAEAPEFSGDAYFRYYGPISTSSGQRYPIGESFPVSNTGFSDLARFVSRLFAMSLEPQYLSVKDGGQFEAVLSGGAKIYFDNKNSVDQQADNLSVILRSDTFSATSSIGKIVDYIDLRFGNKLYYKLK